MAAGLDQVLNAVDIEAPRPAADAGDTDTDLLGHLALNHALAAQQDNPGPAQAPQGSGRTADTTLYFSTFLIQDVEHFDGTSHRASVRHPSRIGLLVNVVYDLPH